tara:strand:+ start:1520 stop:2986 length:1467 start_codon:yes stop_codon:yes gene_type:complete
MGDYNYHQLEERIRKVERGEVENTFGQLREYDREDEISKEDYFRAFFPKLYQNFFDVRRGKSQNWYSFVVEAFYSKEDLDFLKNDLLLLIEDYRNSEKDYFKLSRDENFVLPDRIYLLNKLLIKFKEFFIIYKNIIYNIHFENPIEKNYQKNINGKINWQQTIQMSKTEFPTYFLIEKRKREFQHPGNVLLVLCLKWQQKIVRQILNIDFEEKLEKKVKENLQKMDLRIKNGLLNFPFLEVITEATKYEHIDKENDVIKKLEKQLQSELKQKVIKNFQYQKLLNWLDEFKKIDFTHISEKTSNLSLELIKSIDFTYEGWVFWKIVSKFYEKHPLKNLVINEDEKYFEFEYNNVEIRFYHERKITGWDWNSKHNPDFTVYVKGDDPLNPYHPLDDLIGVFDVKNTDRVSRDARKAVALYADGLASSFSGILYNGTIYAEDKRKKKYTDRTKLYFGISSKKNMTNTNDQILEEFYDEIISEINLYMKNSS